MQNSTPFGQQSDSIPSPYEGVGRAFGRAIVSQMQPRMLLALLLPFAAALIAMLFFARFLWEPLSDWLDVFITQSTFMTEMESWIAAVGLFSVTVYLVHIAMFVIMVTVGSSIGLLIAAVLVMPMVVGHVARTDYPELQRRGSQVFISSMINSTKVMAVFIVGWVLTLPFWLIPPVAIVLHVFWWAYAFTHMLRFDALVEHATQQERALVIGRQRSGGWLIGTICAMINLIPLTWILLPVFTSLVYAHHGLFALWQLRGNAPLRLPAQSNL
ncbi:hypothetical protein CAP48_15905 [Advenella sp. S44]|uniref:EI24 domain-containing protein n=1 Tax=Advenella sp. S44 TaxID=1982755 RepID=UPI000C2AA0DB|nr:EI24 domain-containing protein [Advenella sp. S44]PJX22386.1 hypothetical protein CAP48_15905 [Advenella sp. S44]